MVISKRERIQQLSTDVERYAAACRQAAEQIRKIVDTLPRNRYKGQQEMLRLVAEALDAQAVDVTIEGRMGDPQRVGLIGRLGQLRVAEALTAIGTLTLAGFAAGGYFDDAERCLEQVNQYSVQMVIEAEGAVPGGGQADATSGATANAETAPSSPSLLDERSPYEEPGTGSPISPDPTPPSAPGGGAAQKDATVAPSTVKASASVPPPTVSAGAVVRPVRTTEEQDEAPSVTEVQGIGSTSETVSGVAHVTDGPDRAEGEGSSTPPTSVVEPDDLRHELRVGSPDITTGDEAGDADTSLAQAIEVSGARIEVQATSGEFRSTEASASDDGDDNGER